MKTGASPPDHACGVRAGGLVALVSRVSEVGRPVTAAIESMTGACFVHDRLELRGWEVAQGPSGRYAVGLRPILDPDGAIRRCPQEPTREGNNEAPRRQTLTRLRSSGMNSYSQKTSTGAVADRRPPGGSLPGRQDDRPVLVRHVPDRGHREAAVTRLTSTWSSPEGARRRARSLSHSQ